jgi:hypothetical protein
VHFKSSGTEDNEVKCNGSNYGSFDEIHPERRCDQETTVYKVVSES